MDILFHKGKEKGPLVVFIHGMGMDVRTWAEPSGARILGGRYPLSALAGPDVEIATSFQDLRNRGHSLLSWSQSRPVGPIMTAVAELDELLRRYREQASLGVIFVCHSRGGLVARKYLERPDIPVRVMITIATPHHGTSMARWAAILSPVAAAVNQLIDMTGRDFTSAFRQMLGFLGSPGLKELLPGSRFYSGLKDTDRKGTFLVSVGGTNPDLLRAVSISLPDLIGRVLPDAVVPEEMREGMGDGVVSAASSVLPYADEHLNVHLNHGALLFDNEVRSLVIRTVESVGHDSI
jgi:pimeloyl-ACP methyl ester carboxylesterase